MAEHLQAQIEVVHKQEQVKPTVSESPTTPTDQNTVDQDAINEKDGSRQKGWKKSLGKAGIQRRLLNHSANIVNSVVNRQFDNAISRQSLLGNRRGVQRIQNNKSSYNTVSNSVKGLAGAGITSVAVGNFGIFALQLAGESIELGKKIENRIHERTLFEEKRSLELFTSNRRRERLIVGTYNRR